MSNFHPPIQLGHSLVQKGHPLIGVLKSHLLILFLSCNKALVHIDKQDQYNACTDSNSLLATVGQKSV